MQYLKSFEHFDHWTDSSKLSKIDDVTGIFSSNDLIYIDEDNVKDAPELSHLINEDDYLKIEEYFSRKNEINKPEYQVIFDKGLIGNTIEQAAESLDQFKDDFFKEFLIDLLCIVFPNKYTNIPK